MSRAAPAARPRLGGRPGAVALSALATAHLFLLPLPAVTLQLAAGALATCGALLALSPMLRVPALARAAGLGVALLALRVVIGGLPLPPADAAVTLQPGTVRGTVTALLAPLRGAQRPVIESNGVTILLEVPPNPELFVGDQIRADIEVRTLAPSSVERLRTRGIQASATTRRVELLTRGGALEWLRNRIGDDIERVVPAPAGGLAAAIFVGLRERVDERLATAFTQTGLGHIVALSGWNVAIAMAVVDRALRRTSPRRRRGLLIAAALAFGIFAGASPSVIRASFMATAALLGTTLGRPGTGAIALAHATIALLVMDPATAYDPGFRLSALATAGLLAKSQPWSVSAQRFGARLPRAMRAPWGLIGEDIAVSLAAQAATLGVVIFLFGRVAPWSIPLTLLIAPLIAPATGAAVAAIVAGELAATHLSPLVAAGGIVALPATALFGATAWIADAGNTLPGAGLVVPRAATLPIGALAVVAGAVLLLRRTASIVDASGASDPDASPSTRRPLLVAASLLIVATTISSAGSANGASALRITTLDVGQGDAILVEVGHARMLIDGGPEPSRLSAELDRFIPAWDRRIDLLVASHPHEDHLGGLPRLLDRYQVRSVIGAEDRGGGPAAAVWRTIMSERQVPYRVVHTGDAFQFGGARISVLWPDATYLAAPPANDGRALNDRSIVLRLDDGSFSALFTGDIEADLDARIAARMHGPIDFLKAPHHGSGTSSSRTLLDVTLARASVISVGTGNPYGHPNSATMQRLAERGAWVGRTDHDGAVILTVDLTTGALKIHDASGEVRVPSRTAIATGLSAEVPRAASDASWPAIDVQGATTPVGRLAGGCPLGSATIRAWAHRFFWRGVTISS